MKVKIDCDKRLKERGGTEHEGGWFYGTTKLDSEGLTAFDMKSERVSTYAEVKALAARHGHEIDNAGWKHKLLSWNWHAHSFDQYPGWEIENPDGDRHKRHPAFVKLAHVRGDRDVESSELCNAWDDIAEVDFYQRDWTDNGIPFVDKDETYWSGWWFATIAERDRFVRWISERLPEDGRKTLVIPVHNSAEP